MVIAGSLDLRIGLGHYKERRVKKLVTMASAMLTIILALAGCVAPAETTAADGTGTGGILGYLPMIIILVLLFGMFYFLMVRPMRQREKKHDEMVGSLKVGDRVITAGGVYGEIASIRQDSIIIKIESGATMRVTKGSVLALRSTGDSD
jgi:preprotein translocase subunit YajC